MRVLVTGAAGLLGRTTANALQEAGHEVRGTDRLFAPGLPYRLDVADLCDTVAIYRLLEGIDAVAHFGNYKSDRDPDLRNTYHNNVTANANLFHAAGQLGIQRVVFASTIQVISGVPAGTENDARSTLAYLPIDQDSPLCAKNPYALGKVASEQMLAWCCERFGLTAIALRYPWVARPDHLERFGERVLDPTPMTPSTRRLNEGLSYLHVDDAADLAVRCLTEPTLTGYRHYVMAAPDNIYNLPPAEAIQRFYPNVPLKGNVEQIEGLFDISQITADTGWRAHPRLSKLLAEQQA